MKKIFVLLYLTSFCILNIQGQQCNELDRVGYAIPETKSPYGSYPSDIPKVPNGSVSDGKNLDKKLSFWVHGIGGNMEAWSRARTISKDKKENDIMTIATGSKIYINDLINFPARDMNTATANYTPGRDISLMGSEIRDQLNAGFVTQDVSIKFAQKNNFCITHSMGGINTKRAELIALNNNDQPFPAGGIATFSTPHHGAVLADNMLEIRAVPPEYDFQPFEDQTQTWINANGVPGALVMTEKFRNFYDDMVISLSAGPKNKALNSSPLLSLISTGLSASIDELLLEIGNFLPTLGAGTFLSASILNLKTTDPQLVNTYNFVGASQKAAFYGIESPELTVWRVMYWALNDPNQVLGDLSKPNSNQGYFVAGDDSRALQNFNKMLAQYEINREMTVAEYNNYKPNWVTFSIPSWLISKKHKKGLKSAIEGFDKGINWIKNSTGYWDLMTGARSITLKTHCLCYPENPAQDQDDSYISINCNPIKPTDTCNEITIPTWIYKPNDGVVLNESAQDFKGVNPDHVLPLAESCHFQMRNDQSGKEALLFLYDNDTPELSSFKTEIKP